MVSNYFCFNKNVEKNGAASEFFYTYTIDIHVSEQNITKRTMILDLLYNEIFLFIYKHIPLR